MFPKYFFNASKIVRRCFKSYFGMLQDCSAMIPEKLIDASRKVPEKRCSDDSWMVECFQSSSGMLQGFFWDTSKVVLGSFPNSSSYFWDASRKAEQYFETTSEMLPELFWDASRNVLWCFHNTSPGLFGDTSKVVLECFQSSSHYFWDSPRVAEECSLGIVLAVSRIAQECFQNGSGMLPI